MPGLRKETTKKAVSTPPRRPLRRDAILKALRAAAREREKKKVPQQLARHEHNPIVQPRENRFWEMKATFNPGAIYADRRVHLLYRAIGGDDVSVLGYAASEDGVTITDRSDEPVFVPDTRKKPKEGEAAPMPAYCSGGGWNGGCEDPRLTLIDETVYLMYTAFDGWGSVRIALSSIDLKDFLKKSWEWSKPALISPRGEIHKNWMLFPEKINGKFAILHSIAPKIMIDYFDSLDHFNNEEENVLRGSMRQMKVEEKGRWEMLVRGAGPPPIKTKNGWLVFYHAVDRTDPGKYKLGAMMLAINDPTKVLYRSQGPVLEPEFPYENDGLSSGVVYSCGAVVKDGELYVYYGGADSVVCVAMANLDTFLDELARSGTAKLAPAAAPKIKSDDARN
jgi:beta-1,2-mannobiose phosphorylase / 1,2-beta-oligomannan phosphorylase